MYVRIKDVVSISQENDDSILVAGKDDIMLARLYDQVEYAIGIDDEEEE